MAQVHMTEAELARDLTSALEKVRNGEEILIGDNGRPCAILEKPERVGRTIAEAIAIAKDYEARLGYSPVPDPDFAADVQAAIDAHREPLDVSGWD